MPLVYCCLCKYTLGLQTSTTNRLSAKLTHSYLTKAQNNWTTSLHNAWMVCKTQLWLNVVRCPHNYCKKHTVVQPVFSSGTVTYTTIAPDGLGEAVAMPATTATAEMGLVLPACSTAVEKL